MKIKLSQLVNASESYLKLADQKFLPISIRFSLSEDMEIVQSNLQRFDKFKNELIMKYGQSKDDGSIEVPRNTVNMNKFLLEINELGQKVDIELSTEKISEELFLVDECSLTGKDFFVLRGVFLEPRIKKVVSDEKKVEDIENSSDKREDDGR